MAKTIWFDVTQIHDCGGLLMGMIRVELEIARHLVRRPDEQIRFYRSCSLSRRLLEVSPREVESDIQRLDSYVEPSPSRTSSAAWHRLARQLARTIERLPRPVQAKAVRYIRRMRNAAGSASRTTAGIVGRCLLLFRSIPDGIEAGLRPGDVVVTVGTNYETGIFPGIRAVRERTGIRVMGMCYDLIPVKFPRFLVNDISGPFSNLIVDMARCADRILCLSRNTRDDLKQFLSEAGQPCPSLGVITLGADIRDVSGTVGDRVRALGRDPYILFVSNIEPRKNHAVLCRAYQALAEAGRCDLPSLVFVGRRAWGAEGPLAGLLDDRTLGGSIRVLNHVSDAELRYLYKNALFTVYPSLYEGWGLPVAESLALGKLCIASDASSLPEVGGDFPEYIDPTDVSAWADRLSFYIDNPDAVREREEKIRSEYVPPTWEETARALLDHAEAL